MPNPTNPANEGSWAAAVVAMCAAVVVAGLFGYAYGRQYQATAHDAAPAAGCCFPDRITVVVEPPIQAPPSWPPRPDCCPPDAPCEPCEHGEKCDLDPDIQQEKEAVAQTLDDVHEIIHPEATAPDAAGACPSLLPPCELYRCPPPRRR